MEKCVSKNLLYAQSGGVTSVINASAAGVLSAARNHPEINKIYAALNGIIGVLQEELIDLSLEDNATINQLKFTPGGAFGSCRHKLKSLEQNAAEFARIIDVFKAHNIGYFLYNGGGDSQDTAHKISMVSKQLGYPVVCIGIPKTIDNDLPFTDCSPGFGSVAKYIAISALETGLDIQSMALSSTKVFILEVMGRHAGWIAAAAGLAANNSAQAPHIILFPEIEFVLETFLAKVKDTVTKYGYCSIVASEGIKQNGEYLSANGNKDSFGHAQLGGVAINLAAMIKQHLGYKLHYAIADYMQRSAGHITSKTDVDQAYALGKAAVNLAINNQTGYMPIIVRKNDLPYEWEIGAVEIEKVANIEKKMPRDYITEDGFGVTHKCKTYMQPLIEGEHYPSYVNGIPHYAKLNKILVTKKLSDYNCGYK